MFSMLADSASSARSRLDELRRASPWRPRRAARARAARPAPRRRRRLGRQPLGVRRELADDGRPVGLGELRARAEQRRHGGVAQRRERCGVRRVDGARERQRPLGRDERQREARDLLGASRPRSLRRPSSTYSSSRRLSDRGGARVEGHEPAAREVVVDLVLDGRERGVRRGRAVRAEGQHGARRRARRARQSANACALAKNASTFS